jgi:hypothetical protein
VVGGEWGLGEEPGGMKAAVSSLDSDTIYYGFSRIKR